MKKLLILPLVAVLGTIPAVLPAQAASSRTDVPYCTGGDEIGQDADMIQLKLRANGVAATSVEEWNGCVRAFVQTGDGHEAMYLFDPETLQPLGQIG